MALSSKANQLRSALAAIDALVRVAAAQFGETGRGLVAEVVHAVGDLDTLTRDNLRGCSTYLAAG
jgi:hypothetical protein